jgi:hypothetical protein
MAANSNDLFFSAAVKSYIDNPRFLRRDWLAAEVEKRLEEPDCRFLLLTRTRAQGRATSPHTSG